MKLPSKVKEIQSLTGRAAALNRFLSRSTDKCKPFFKALKKGQRDKWDEKCEAAFQNLKTYLTSPLLLSKPVPGEDLFVYLDSVELSCQFSSHPRRARGPTSDILNVKSFPRCRDSPPEITLLPSSSSHRYDRLSFKINHPQP
ncbi:uncharacterized protein LOC109947133 [Prunus persica]|uniref:uncharacterized protein LOC109947133 n=1 Tax=Prunus persica TaxID=3760 RepID=UPI0009AB3A19|nr:uncharacterized protein LOC109947133 [Prunus persica]